MSGDQDVDYEDLTTMRLDDDALDAMLREGGERIFNWTTREGHPVGVVVAFIYHEGKFFTTCAERDKRVPALRKRPQSGIVINQAGRTASYKGESTVHANGDPGFDELKAWFYPKLSRLDAEPDDPYRQSFCKFLDSPHRVIIETDARLVVAFDTKKFQQFTVQAMAAAEDD